MSSGISITENWTTLDDSFNALHGIAIDNDGNMFVAEDGRDGGGGSIRKVTPEAVVTTYAGNGEAVMWGCTDGGSTEDGDGKRSYCRQRNMDSQETIYSECT